MRMSSIYRLLLILAALYVNTTFASNTKYSGLLLSPTKQINPANLVTDTGKKITFPVKNDRYQMLFFGYTNCPDVCPLTMYKVKSVLRELGDNANNIDVYFVSIDPDRDSLSTLGKYVSFFDKRIIGITGDHRNIKALEKEFGIITRKFRGQSALTYTMQHSVFMYILDKNGQLKLMHPASSDTRDITRDIKALMASRIVKPEIPD